MSTDSSIHAVLRRLLREQRVLRTKHADRVGDPQAQLERLRQLQDELERCWHLLLQRPALRSAGSDVGKAKVPPAGQ